MSNPGFTTLNEDYLEVQLSSKNLSNQTLLLRIGQLEEYLERVGEPKKFKIDLDFRDNPKVTDTDLEFDGFGRLVAFLKKFGTFVTRLRIGGTGISGSGLCELIDFIKMGAAEELDFSNLPGVEQDEVVALLMAVKESGQYPLQKSLPLLFRLDRNGLEKPHEIIALVSQDLCCEVLTDPCELQKATVARNKVHRGEAEPTEVMISLPEFYLQSEEAVVTTPVPQTPKSAPSTPEKSEKKPLNLRAKAPPPPAPPAPCAEQMEDVKVEEEDLPVVGSLPKAFCGSRAKKASPVGVSILPLANPKPPDHIPPAHVMWKNLSTSAKARKWMEVEIQKSVMTKASSRCDSTALAQGVPETVPIYGMGVPPPNERPKPTKATALASPMPPPLSPPSPPSPPPPWSPWSRESSTVAIPAKPRPPQRSEETSFTPGIPSAKSQVVQVLTQVAAGGKAISQAAQSDALRMLEKFTKSDAVPKPTSSEVRKMPSPQQKQVASGSQEWNHSEGKEEWKDWSERKWGDWSGAPWRREWSDQAWSEWDNKKETTWDAKKETTWDFKKESAWGVKQESTWDVKQESAWGVKQESTWDVKQESAWDDKETTWEPKKETPYPETAWDVKKEGTWDVKKETTWDVKKETTWNVKQEITWDVKQEWSWTGQFEKDENSQAQSWKHTEVKAEEWNDWNDWKTAGHWEKPVTSTTSTTWPEEKEWTRRWSEKASEEQDSEWKERKSQPPEGRAEEKPSVEKASTEVEGALADVDDGDDDEPSERIGRYAMILERWKEKKEQYQQDLKKSRASRAELKQELSLQQDACRDNSEDPSEPETEAFEAFPRVPAPSAAYEAYDSIYEDVEEELEEAEADPMDPMDVDEVAKRSREILRKARGQVPQRPGKRGRSPLPQEPPYPPPKKGRTGGRRSSLRGPPRRKKKGGLDDSKAVAVDIRNLLYSQKSCKDTFQCGRSVDQLVKDLETGKVDLSAPFLRLTVFETREEKSRKPELRCIDNRRLLALKEYAKKIGNPKLKVNISLFSEETLTQVQRFFQNSDDTDGRDVRLRTSRNDKRRQLVD